MTAELSLPSMPSGHTVFCDDIRQEINGKLSLIGTYNAAMYVVHDFPITLPRLCLLVTYMERVSELTDGQTGQLTLRIHLPGEPEDEPHAKLDLPEDEYRHGREAVGDGHYTNPEERDVINISRIPLEISPCLIREPGPIRVRMQCGDKIYKLGSLVVVPASPEILAQHKG